MKCELCCDNNCLDLPSLTERAPSLNEMECSFGRSRMRNGMKMNNHHILSNTAT